MSPTYFHHQTADPVRLNRTHQQWNHIYAVQSFSNPDTLYFVSYSDSREMWGCSCRAWTAHVPRRDCKHIAFVQTWLGGIPVSDDTSSRARQATAAPVLTEALSQLKARAEAKWDEKYSRASFIEL